MSCKVFQNNMYCMTYFNTVSEKPKNNKKLNTVYSEAELAKAKADGRYISDEDGYIFKASDIISDEAIQYIVKHGDYVGWIPKESLSDKELKEAEVFCKTHGILEPKENDISYFDASKDDATKVYERAKVSKIIPVDHMPYNAVYAVAYKNGHIIIPHHTHFHNIAVDWFNDPEAFKAPIGYSLEDFFSTVKYYLAHPEERPVSRYGWGGKKTEEVSHTNEVSKPVESIPVKPLENSHPERIGKPNTQIVYTEEEVEAAKAAGKYTTDDGYIFDPHDVSSDAGDAFIVPHLNHSHWIPKADLSKSELEAALAYLKTKEVSTDSVVTPTPSSSKSEEEKSTSSVDRRDDSTDAFDNKDEVVTPSESAESVYNRVTAANIIPEEKLPYGLSGAKSYQNGRISIPDSLIFSSLSLHGFDDGLYNVPEGYSLEDLMATIKYYIEKAQSPINNNEIVDTKEDDSLTTSTATSNASEDEEESEDEDEYTVELKRIADSFGVSVDLVQQKLTNLSLKYGVTSSEFRYDFSARTISLITSQGEEKVINFDTLSEVN